MLGDSGRDGTCVSADILCKGQFYGSVLLNVNIKAFLQEILRVMLPGSVLMCSSRKQQQVMYLYYRICIRIVLS